MHQSARNFLGSEAVPGCKLWTNCLFPNARLQAWSRRDQTASFDRQPQYQFARDLTVAVHQIAQIVRERVDGMSMVKAGGSETGSSLSVNLQPQIPNSGP